MSQYTKEVNAYLLAIQQGDTTQFELLYQYTAVHLLGVARYYLNNKNLAEDVLEEVFIKVFNYIHSFDCSKDGYNWLCKIVQHEAHNVNVAEARLARTEADYAKAMELMAERDCLGDLNFFDTLTDLDETEYFIAKQRFYFNDSLEEIGRDLGITRAAVCKRLKKICKIIKKNLK